jgi:hypothetical protein
MTEDNINIKTLQRKIGYKIVHFIATDAGAATITNDSRNIRLNPMSFPFNGRCRIYLTELAFSSAPAAAGANFVNICLCISQPYAQSNMPFDGSSLSKATNIIHTHNPTTLLGLSPVITYYDMKGTYIDAILSPHSIIQVNIFNELGVPVNLSAIDKGYIVHLYIKSLN